MTSNPKRLLEWISPWIAPGRIREHRIEQMIERLQATDEDLQARLDRLRERVEVLRRTDAGEGGA